MFSFKSSFMLRVTLLFTLSCGTTGFVLQKPQQSSVFRDNALAATANEDEGTVLGSKYVLDDQGETSTSGKSTLIEATPWQEAPHQYNYHHHQQQQQPDNENDRVVVKFSDNIKALKREAKNYDKVTNEETKDLFVEIHDFYNPSAAGGHTDTSASGNVPGDGTPQFKGLAALVMERGSEDLASYLRQNGPLQGMTLYRAMATSARAVQACHDQDMVWTELKATNFVVPHNEDGQSNDITIKAIDLESAVRRGSPPLDFSPEAIPPEFALAFVCGREPYMEIQPSFDVFSLGLLWYEMATGRNYWIDYLGEDNLCQVRICNELRTTQGKMPLPPSSHNQIEPWLQELIGQCLQVDADARPTVQDLLNHPQLAQVVL